MLPNVYSDDLVNDFIMYKYPSRTYRLNFNGSVSNGFIMGTEAMKQAIFLILNCERYNYEIFSWNYGIELQDKVGCNNDLLLQAEIKAAIVDALLQDDRILEAADFVFTRKNKKQLSIEFKVITTEGEVAGELLWDNQTGGAAIINGI